MKLNEILEIEIDLTGVCNLECPLCTRNYKHANHLKISNQRDISQIIQQLETFTSLNRVMLAGAVSEPLIYKDILLLIEYLNSRNIYIDLFTNGYGDTNLYIKLGKLFNNNPKSTCTFTICGSTQELHEKYRVGSNLQKILDNSKAFKLYNNTSADILQIIEFQYNTEDIQNIINNYSQFYSKYYIVQSEGVRRFNEYNKSKEHDIAPIIIRDTAIKSIYNREKYFNSNSTLMCKSKESCKVHIDQFGKIFPCYMIMEYPESKDFEFLQNNELDYSEILKNKFPCCFLCEKNTRMLIEKSNLNFVC